MEILNFNGPHLLDVMKISPNRV